MNEGIKIWSLLAGLGLFLFGMAMLEEALKNIVGRKFKLFLRKHTKNPVKAVLAGAGVTAILQSSSMVTLLVMSFAGAGIIGLKNGIGMIMGANLGTTFTGWLVSMLGFKTKIEMLIMPFFAIGGLGMIFLKSERLNYFSKFLMGFSFMFLGLSYMKDGTVEFAEQIDFGFLAGRPMILFTLIGFVICAAIQSSSASMMIFLSSLAAGIITFEQSLYMVIGSDMGTTVTALIGTLKANSIRKKVGWSQFYFNAVNAVFALLLMSVYVYLIRDVLRVKDDLFGMVAFHSILNLSGIILILPFLRFFTNALDRFIKEDERKLSTFISLVSSSETHSAIIALHSDAELFLRKAIKSNHAFFKHDSSGQSDDALKNYFELKKYESELADYYLSLQQNSLSDREAESINYIIASIRNATLCVKDIKDIKHNLDELRTSVNDRNYNFFKEIAINQLRFYDEASTFMDNLKYSSPEDTETLGNLNMINYQQENESLTSMYDIHKKHEIDIATLLNLLREVNNSNESLLRSIRNLTLVNSFIHEQ
jgi:phosphate:Na+ symporter